MTLGGEEVTAILTPLGILLVPIASLWLVPELRRRCGMHLTALKIAPFGCLGAAVIAGVLLWLLPFGLRQLSLWWSCVGIALALASAWFLMRRAFLFCRRRTEHPELLDRSRFWAWAYFAILTLVLLVPWTLVRTARLLVESRNRPPAAAESHNPVSADSPTPVEK